ncbi:MAG: hypothetical protein ACYTGZ_03700 [Planctomycetota bacterium]|jgi:hypothetical protein
MRPRKLLLLLFLLSVVASAKNIDLVTLPTRDTVQLTIYNSEDITLVKETRYVTFKRGVNRLQFSWANTLIDPSSVEFRPLAHQGDIELADTVYPGQKPQHLIWNIDSRFEGQVPVEVTYFTSGLTWTMDYVAITNPGETAMDFSGHVRVYNRSGEEYEDAEIRLIVGKINLVEKIAELARRQGIPVPKKGSPAYRGLEKKAGRKAFDRAESRARDAAKSAKRIVKEGLSEYFMFSIEGTETVRNGWSKRMRAVQGLDTKFRILYRMRAHQYGPRPVRFFLWRNDDEHKLGEAPLPDGRVRIFKKNGNDGMSFLGEQLIRYVPIKAPIEINLGPDDLVIYETRRIKSERFNFRYRRSNNREYVSGWDERTGWVDTIRNYRDKPITLELRRIWAGDVEYTSEIDTKLFDYRTIETTLAVGTRVSVEYPCVVLTHYGENKKQNRIRIK